MKKLIILLLIVPMTFVLHAQEKEIIKKGWNLGALPTVTFDSDLGFQYGALVDLYNYGDGSRFPVYNYKLYFEVSRFTKGSGINRFFFDSDKLITGLRTSVDLSYLSDQAYDFYGFNGYDAVYNNDYVDDASSGYKTRMFYKYDRKLFRFKVDLQGKLAPEKFRWIAGFNLQNFKLGLVDIDKLNKGKEGADKLPDHSVQPGLFQKYQDWNIISKEEADGGFVPTFKAGMVLDTRDNEPNPMKGVWTELVFEGSPEMMGSESSFAKFMLVHRQYFTLIPNDLSFGYRLAYQSTLGGDVPFYYQSQVITSILTSALSEGLGGSKTLRGILRNRIVGDGFFYGNAELRYKFYRFQFLNSNWYLGLNAFTDFGQVTRRIDLPFIAPSRMGSDFYKADAEKMHISYGAGLRIVMNQNFVIAVDYGRATSAQDGKSGMYIGLNYLF